MKKYFLAVASFFIYSHISLGQVYPGQMDSTFVPVRSHHYDPELTFDFCVNEPAWNNQAGIHSAFGSTDRLYFRKEVPVNHNNDLSSSYSTTVWRGGKSECPDIGMVVRSVGTSTCLYAGLEERRGKHHPERPDYLRVGALRIVQLSVCREKSHLRGISLQIRLLDARPFRDAGPLRSPFPNHPSGMDDGGCAERNRSRHV